MIYSTEGRSPDAGRELVGNKGGTDTDYIRVLGFRSGTRLGGRIADPNKWSVQLPLHIVLPGPDTLPSGCAWSWQPLHHPQECFCWSQGWRKPLWQDRLVKLKQGERNLSEGPARSKMAQIDPPICCLVRGELPLSWWSVVCGQIGE